MDHGAAATHALLREKIPDILEGLPMLRYEARADADSDIPPVSASRPTLHALISSDTPRTLYVGAKRYPVETVWLEDVYRHPITWEIPKAEAVQVAGVQQKMSRAASAYRSGGYGGYEGRTGTPTSVSDAVQFNDQEKSALLTLAARIALAVARPGTPDCILIFVSGMADIDSLVNTFLELAPHAVAAPTAKLAVGEEVEEDADLRAAEEVAARSQRAVGRALAGGESEESGEGEPPASPSAPNRGESSSTGTSTIRLLPMHSLISFDDQIAAFDTSTDDPRTRVVIATNIAESSITIPGVSTIIDLGRAKTMEYVPKFKASLLRATWISQASATQRTGRAGRVRPGTCFRLYTQSFHDAVMPRYDVPEMLRLSLDNVVLKVKMLGMRTSQVEGDDGSAWDAHGTFGDGEGAESNEAEGASAKAILSRCIQAPDTSNVDVALSHLAAIGALESADDTAGVTPLGRVLSSFPGGLEVGKMVVFGVLLGCVPDAIVLAAVLASQDIFMLPHVGLADSLQDFATANTKVVRSRWLFGRDSTLSCIGEEPLACSWSEPITARNAYVAWRCVHPKQRQAWAAGLGLVHRRILGVHSLVQEISHRFCNDNPTLRSVIRPLLAGGRGAESAEAQDGDEGEHQHGAEAWPPAGTFTTNTHLLRLLLTSSQLSNLCVGKGGPAGASRIAYGLGMDDTRSVMVLLDPAQGVPTEWVTSLKLPMDAAALSTASGLHRSLSSIGVQPGGVSKTRVDEATGKKGKQGPLVAGLEFEPDWQKELQVLMSERWLRYGTYRGDTTTVPAPGLPLGSRVHVNARRLLGAAEQRPDVDAVQLGTVAYSPIARALPVQAQILAMMAGPRCELKLPYIPPDRTAEEEEARKTGVRRLVPGAVFVDSPGKGKGSPAPSSLPGLGFPPASPPTSRAALPSSMTGTTALPAGAAVDVTAMLSMQLGWATNPSLSGHRVFGSTQDTDNGDEDEEGMRSQAGQARTYAGRLHPHSPLRLAIVDPSQAGLRAGGRGREDEHESSEGEGEHVRGRSRSTRADIPSCLLSVSGTLQLQESVRNGRASYSAAMSGTTILWRDPTTVAMACLLFSRGVCASLQWRVEYDTAWVHRVMFDPHGRDPLVLGPCRITLGQLMEVNDIRQALTERTAGRNLAADQIQAMDLQGRMLRVLQLGDSGFDVSDAPAAVPEHVEWMPCEVSSAEVEVQDMRNELGIGHDWQAVLGLQVGDIGLNDPGQSAAPRGLLPPFTVVKDGSLLFGCPCAVPVEPAGKAMHRKKATAAGTAGRQSQVANRGESVRGGGASARAGSDSAAGTVPGKHLQSTVSGHRKADGSSPKAGVDQGQQAAAGAEESTATADAALNRAKHMKKQAEVAVNAAESSLKDKQALLKQIEPDVLQSWTELWGAADAYRRAANLSSRSARSSAAAGVPAGASTSGREREEQSIKARARLVRKLLQWQASEAILKAAYKQLQAARSRRDAYRDEYSLCSLAFDVASCCMQVAKAVGGSRKAGTGKGGQGKTAGQMEEAAQAARRRLALARDKEKASAGTLASRTRSLHSSATAAEEQAEGWAARVKEAEHRLKACKVLLKAVVEEEVPSAGVPSSRPSGLSKLYSALVSEGVDMEDAVSAALHLTREGTSPTAMPPLIATDK